MKLPFSKDQHTKIAPQIWMITYALLLAFALHHFKSVWGFVCTLCSLASPFFIGFALAFLLGPVQRAAEKVMQPLLFKKRQRPKLMHALSALFSLSFLVFLVYVFLKILVPQLITSITSVVGYISNFLSDNQSLLNQILLKYDFLNLDGDELVLAWDNIVSSQIKNITMLLDNLFAVSSSIANFIYNLLVGLITAFYIMMDKDRIAAQIKKIGYSIMKREHIESLIQWTRRANRIFSGFISGKLVDSLIMGLICYFGMLIFRMEYALLISCIIGVTNIIPFFGPFIGWAPSALILLIVNPMSALWFTVFILFLQQLDGNVIGPHILGDYVGVSALSIMIAIVIGGGLFGFVGMLVSVPVYALGYAFFRALIYDRLKKRKLPIDTEEYIHAPETLPREEAAEREDAEVKA